jgi:hypothetical protein
MRSGATISSRGRKLQRAFSVPPGVKVAHTRQIHLCPFQPRSRAMNEAEKSKKADAKPAADPKAAEAAKNAPLKDADLDNVAGGLNPQPLPPMPRVLP